MTSGIYAIKNKINGKIYIGSSSNIETRFKRHKRELKKGNHHNAHLQRSYEKYGDVNFEFYVLEETENLFEQEQNWIDNIGIELYNIGSVGGGDNLSKHPNKEAIIEKRTEKFVETLNNMTEEERKQKYGRSMSMFGKKHSDETKIKMSKNQKRKYGEENHFYGKTHTEETKQIISNAASKRVGDKNPFYGKKHSEETLNKISEKNKGKKPVNIRRVVANGEVYESVSDCAKNNEISPALVIYRIKSEKYDYRYE